MGPPPPPPPSFRNQFDRFRPALFFILGFVFDILTLGRIDSWENMLGQALYLGAVCFLLKLEIKESLLMPIKIRNALIHFFLGGLLSLYTLFYFKSSSLVTSFLFLLLLAFLLIANEFAGFRGKGFSLRVTMFTLCLASYFIYLVPILLGFIGIFPFLLSLIVSAGVSYLAAIILTRSIPPESPQKRRMLWANAGVHLSLLILYLLNAIPPIPLSIQYMGIYHDIQKEGDQYALSYTRPQWKFWQYGDQSFAYTEGDALYAFVSIYSPAGFNDQVHVKWFFYDPKHGWQQQDSIPLKISGGREQGFRGFSVKQHFQKGRWRVHVDTTDGREVGRLSFHVFPEPDFSSREIKTEYR